MKALSSQIFRDFNVVFCLFCLFSHARLNEKESCEFITYWLPELLKNKISLCSFQKQEFFDNFELDINPKPKSVLRVFLSIKKLDHPVNVKEQKLESFERKGFSVVEWGGSEINDEIKEITY